MEWADKNPFVPVTIRAEAFGMNGVVGTHSVSLPAIDVVDETNVASVLLDVTVLDAEGRYVRELTREHFSVFEDDRQQTIDLVDSTLVPTTVTLLATRVRACRTASISPVAQRDALGARCGRTTR